MARTKVGSSSSKGNQNSRESRPMAPGKVVKPYTNSRQRTKARLRQLNPKTVKRDSVVDVAKNAAGLEWWFVMSPTTKRYRLELRWAKSKQLALDTKVLVLEIWQVGGLLLKVRCRAHGHKTHEYDVNAQLYQPNLSDLDLPVPTQVSDVPKFCTTFNNMLRRMKTDAMEARENDRPEETTVDGAASSSSSARMPKQINRRISLSATLNDVSHVSSSRTTMPSANGSDMSGSRTLVEQLTSTPLRMPSKPAGSGMRPGSESPENDTLDLEDTEDDDDGPVESFLTQGLQQNDLVGSEDMLLGDDPISKPKQKTKRQLQAEARAKKSTSTTPSNTSTISPDDYHTTMRKHYAGLFNVGIQFLKPQNIANRSHLWSNRKLHLWHVQDIKASFKLNPTDAISTLPFITVAPMDMTTFQETMINMNNKMGRPGTAKNIADKNPQNAADRADLIVIDGNHRTEALLEIWNELGGDIPDIISLYNDRFVRVPCVVYCLKLNGETLPDPFIARLANDANLIKAPLRNGFVNNVLNCRKFIHKAFGLPASTFMEAEIRNEPAGKKSEGFKDFLAFMCKSNEQRANETRKKAVALWPVDHLRLLVKIDGLARGMVGKDPKCKDTDLITEYRFGTPFSGLCGTYRRHILEITHNRLADLNNSADYADKDGPGKRSREVRQAVNWTRTAAMKSKVKQHFLNAFITEFGVGTWSELRDKFPLLTQPSQIRKLITEEPWNGQVTGQFGCPIPKLWQAHFAKGRNHLATVREMGVGGAEKRASHCVVATGTSLLVVANQMSGKAILTAVTASDLSFNGISLVIVDRFQGDGTVELLHSIQRLKKDLLAYSIVVCRGGIESMSDALRSHGNFQTSTIMIDFPKTVPAGHGFKDTSRTVDVLTWIRPNTLSTHELERTIYGESRSRVFVSKSKTMDVSLPADCVEGVVSSLCPRGSWILDLLPSEDIPTQAVVAAKSVARVVVRISKSCEQTQALYTQLATDKDNDVAVGEFDKRLEDQTATANEHDDSM